MPAVRSISDSRSLCVLRGEARGQTSPPGTREDDIRPELSGGELVRMRDMYAKSAREKKAMSPVTGGSVGQVAHKKTKVFKARGKAD